MTIQRDDDRYENGVLVERRSYTLDGEEAERYLAPDRLRTFYATARAWASDAEAVADGWAGLSNADKDAALRQTVRRVGKLLEALADELAAGGRSA